MIQFSKSLADVSVPKMIYGTAWKEKQTTQLVIKAIKNGFRGIDTACQPKHYQEDLVGLALISLFADSIISREELYVQTKYTPISGQDPQRVPYDAKADLETQVKQSIAKSLSNLQIEYIDCVLIHSPLKNLSETMTVWRAFEQFVESGTIRQIGISNIYNLELFKKIFEESKVKPSIIQNRFYSDSKYDKDLRAFCRKEGVLYQSFWTLTANPQILSNKQVVKFADELGISTEQLFYRFIMQLGIIPLNGTTNEDHMRNDLEVLNLPDLNEEVYSFICSLINE